MGKYSSRKLGVVILLIVLTTILALMGKLTAEVSQIFTGLGIVYPAAQGWVDGKSNNT